jgi:hypothetical protein
MDTRDSSPSQKSALSQQSFLLLFALVFIICLTVVSIVYAGPITKSTAWQGNSWFYLYMGGIVILNMMSYIFRGLTKKV